MLIAPVVVGAWPRPSWATVLLLLTALEAFCALYTVGTWLKSGRKGRYAQPAAVHTGVAFLLVALLVLIEPHLLAWAWLFVPVLALSLWASMRREDRSWWNDIVLVVLAGAATLVSAGLRGDQFASVDGGGSVLAWPPPGWDAREAWFSGALLLAYFLGTIVHTKALIRDRRNPRVRLGSVAYHAIVLVGGVVVASVLGHRGANLALLLPTVVASGLLLARSWYLPYRAPGTPVRTIGLVEVAMTVIVSVSAIALGAAALQVG